MLLGDQKKSRQLSFHVYQRHMGRFLVGLYFHDNSRVSKTQVCFILFAQFNDWKKMSEIVQYTRSYQLLLEYYLLLDVSYNTLNHLSAVKTLAFYHGLTYQSASTGQTKKIMTTTIQLTLELTSSQVVETSFSNSSFQTYSHPDDHTI